MTISKTYSAIPSGLAANLVSIECDSTNGLPSLNIIGMANKTVEESRERIRSAIRNSGFSIPTEAKITINLAPAELPKSGSHLDLAIAAAILAHFGQLPAQEVANTIFAGELALDGKIRPIKGILNIAKCAKRRRIRQIFIPYQNAAQAALVCSKSTPIFPIRNLIELWEHLTAVRPIKPLHKTVVKNTDTVVESPILDDIIGLATAKRALVVAIAGHHNIILAGPPGAGKSMLASTAPSLLPPLSQTEITELTKIQSLISASTAPQTNRPFRAPHHSASRPSIIGGADGLPGEITLSHLGVLFLDELPEYNRDVLESLRQPLENKAITLNHAHQKIKYPANFMLIATMNPCPCGNKYLPDKICTCTPNIIANYRRKLSGPLLDRIDLHIQVPRTDTSILLKNTTSGTREHQTAKKLIQSALNTQINRCGKYNSDLSSAETIEYCTLTDEAKEYYNTTAKRYKLSARSYFKILKVARTIADLDQSETVTQTHLAEAFQYRQEI